MTRNSALAHPDPRHRSHRAHRILGVLIFVALLASATLTSSISSASANGYSTTLAEVSDRIGATPLAYQGITGAGVDVAVIDTGVEPVPGLDGYDKLIIGPDLSFEAGVPEFYGRDTYGHGTAMASIIAGDDGAGYQGVAPGARILSMKVADNTGAVDVTQVIAALDWIVENGQSNGLNVRIINLSYVTDSDQDYEIDPLAYAVERAWRAGYVVVVAAGNAGAETSILGNPATDPFVISVAASDGSGAAEFTSSGSKTRMPDVLAPGDRILGLAAPESRLVQDHPSAFIDGRYLRGSGTSQSTAIVSGAAALLLEERPELTPDQVKALLILGTVDDNGVGRAASLDPIAGLSEFFDLMDTESELRDEANDLQSEAAALRARAHELSGEAVLLRSDSAVLIDEQTKLLSEAPLTRGFEAIVLEDDLVQAQLDTQIVTVKAIDVSDEGSALEREALALEAKAAALLEQAEKVRHAAEQVRIPEHMRQLEISLAEERLAKELFSQEELLNAEAATLRKSANELLSRARALSLDIEPIRVRSTDRLGLLAPVEDENVATREAISELILEAQSLDAQAAEIETKAHALKKDAKDALARAEVAAILARTLKAEHDAAMALVFANWDGTGLGAIDFDPRGGAGHIDIERSSAMEAFDAVQSHRESTGSGSIEAARGTNHVTLPDGSLLEGEITFAGSTWTGSTWTGSTWTGSTWTGSTWTGSTWTGSTWTGSTWTGSTWTGSTWTGSTWTGSTWTGSTWTGSTWTGSTWTGSAWG